MKKPEADSSRQTQKDLGKFKRKILKFSNFFK